MHKLKCNVRVYELFPESERENIFLSVNHMGLNLKYVGFVSIFSILEESQCLCQDDMVWDGPIYVSNS